jgi:hypothetical protein
MLLKGELVLLFPDQSSSAEKDGAAIHAVRMPGRSHVAKSQLFITHLRDVFGDPPFWDNYMLVCAGL